MKHPFEITKKVWNDFLCGESFSQEKSEKVQMFCSKDNSLKVNYWLICPVKLDTDQTKY
jgi:hypothetical protein